MKGYWIVSVNVADPETYSGYLAANKSAFDKFGARFLARGGRYEAPEGPVGSRNVIIEFESFETALACYDSAEYQEALKIRLASSTAHTVILEGV